MIQAIVYIYFFIFSPYLFALIELFYFFIQAWTVLFETQDKRQIISFQMTSSPGDQ